jgi:HAD superfamily hydrolase (TIGR01459 family)
MTPLRSIPGLAAVADQYGVLLVDQFGTLHDGQTPYPHAAEALVRYRATGGKVVVLSNSAKSGDDNRERLKGFGFDERHFDAVVTSGDAAQAAMRAGSLGPAFQPGGKIHISGKPGADYGFGAFGFTIAWPDDADGIILAASQEPDRNWRQQIRDLLGAARRGVTIAVCNPDLEMLTPKGVRPSAGAIALELERAGAVLRTFGKPHGDIYRTALAAAGNPPPSAVLAIGDSPEHDLQGAANAALDGALVRTGILVGQDEAALLPRLPKRADRPWLSLPELRW